MPAMTPIRVRGKRGATQAEKWHAGKKRRLTRAGSPALSERSAASSSTTASQMTVSTATRKRKRKEVQLSRLEELPTEILQEIFEYSANLDLPFVSRGIQAQLSGKHLHLRLTSCILNAVVGLPDGSSASNADCDVATRLLGSRFLTWDLFQSWLEDQRKHVEAGPLPEACSHGLAYDKWLWNKLNPPPTLRVPLKLLRGPWADEKMAFLDLLSPWRGADDKPANHEHAYSGLCDAIAESSLRAVVLLLRFGVRPDTEMLLKAVVDHGCDRKIVGSLAFSAKAYHLEACQQQTQDARSSEGHLLAPSSALCDIDFLDPILWSWAEKARANGHENGQWLLTILRQHADEAREWQSNS